MGSFDHVNEGCQCEGKWCSQCKSTMCFGCFHRNKNGKHGLAHHCKKCTSERGKQYNSIQVEKTRTWRKANPERVKELAKKSKQKHSVEYNAKTRLWRLDNAEKLKNYRDAHKKELLLNSTRWRKNHPEYMRLHERRKYLKRCSHHTKAGGITTPEEWEMLKSRYGYICLCCERKEPEIELTMDHVIPLSMSGSNGIENIQPLCRSCNSIKWTQTIDYRQRWRMN